jgi:radical SAM superfamily enzyme YgiQ (UPF0313 family)
MTKLRGLALIDGTRNMSPRILMVNPNLMKPPVAPIGLDYLHSRLQQAGFEVRLLDLAFSNEVDKEIEHTVDDDYLFIGISLRNVDDSYFASQDFCLQRSQEIIGKIGGLSSCPIVLGGVGFSVFPIQVMRYCSADFGIYGDGELALCMLARALQEKTDYRAIPGLFCKDSCQFIPPRYLDLEKISLAQRDLVDNVRYFQEGAMVAFETKRGCNRPCIYCAEPVAKGRKVRSRDPRDVAMELTGLLRQGITHFHTGDSEFNVPEEHAKDVCRAIIAQGLGDKIQWYAYCLAAPFSEELAHLMRRAGCVGIDFTVDSGSEGQLRRLGHLHRVADITRLARLCHRCGFSFMFDLLLGGPGETRKTVKETLELMKSLEPTRVGISLGVRLYPDTSLGNMVKRQGLTRQNPNLQGTIDDNSTMLRPLFYLSHELGDDIDSHIRELIKGDERFFFVSREQTTQNYNYNDNSQLMEAIRNGYRGAFWDILRRLSEE